MNKFAKGSVAAGAGIVLLLGGAGTLAYWNDTAELTGGTISAGSLTLEEPQQGTWAQNGTTIENVADFSMVPGDTVTYVSEVTLDAQGDNIQGTLELDQDALILAPDADPQAADQFTITVDAAHEGLTEVSEGFFRFDGEGTYIIPVTVTIDFPFDKNDEQNDSQDAMIDLQKISFTATQTDPETTPAA